METIVWEAYSFISKFLSSTPTLSNNKEKAGIKVDIEKRIELICRPPTEEVVTVDIL